MNVNLVNPKGRKRLKKIKTWTDKEIEKLSGFGKRGAVLIKVRSMFSKRGFIFGLKEVGAEFAYNFYNTQKQAHLAWMRDWKDKTEKVEKVEKVEAPENVQTIQVAV